MGPMAKRHGDPIKNRQNGHHNHLLMTGLTGSCAWGYIHLKPSPPWSSFLGSPAYLTGNQSEASASSSWAVPCLSPSQILMSSVHSEHAQFVFS